MATIGLCLDLASVGLCLFDAYGVHDGWGEPWTEILSSERTGTKKKKLKSTGTNKQKKSSKSERTGSHKSERASTLTSG